MRQFSQFFIGFKKGMGNFSSSIALLVSAILLALVYFIGAGLTSVIAKLSGKHFLEMKLLKKGTYWSDLNLKTKPLKEYCRQF